MARLRIGILGCGTMGRRHALLCRELEGVEVAGVADLRPERAAALAREVGARAYTSLEDLLEGARPHALVMATPPGQRREAVRLACSAGVSLLVEKPLALTLEDARAMWQEAERAGVVHAVGFQLRHCPLTEWARELLDSPPHLVRSLTTTAYHLTLKHPEGTPLPLWYLRRDASGGPLLEQAIHMLDCIRHLAGEVEEVIARGEALVTAPSRARGADAEDTAVLAFRLRSGALGTHTDSSAHARFHWEVEFFTPKGHLRVDYARGRLTGHRNGQTVERTAPPGDWHRAQMEAFLAAVRQDNPRAVRADFGEGVRTLAVALAGARSLRTGRWERVEENPTPTQGLTGREPA